MSEDLLERPDMLEHAGPTAPGDSMPCPIFCVSEDVKLANLGAAPILREAGYELVTAEAAHFRWSLLLSDEYRLVIVEISTPDGPGLGLCRRLRAVTSAPLLVILYPEVQKAVSRAFDAGADMCSMVPLRKQEFLARVHALLRRGRQPAS